MIPWWGVVLIVAGSLGLGAFIALVGFGIYIARGFYR